MGTAHFAASRMDRRHNDLFRRKFIDHKAHRCHVHDRVHGPHLVEVDLVRHGPVDLGLRFRDQAVHTDDVIPHLFRQRETADDGFDIRQMMVLVMVMVMLMVMFVMVMVMVVQTLLFHSADLHGNMGPVDPALHRLFAADDGVRDAEAVQPGDHTRGIRMQLKKGCGQHVARGAHVTLKI